MRVMEECRGKSFSGEEHLKGQCHEMDFLEGLTILICKYFQYQNRR
jgi:hypothetical protein